VDFWGMQCRVVAVVVGSIGCVVVSYEECH
jgi:hypothetical protein